MLFLKFKQIQINNQTFNITQANNLTVRNAIDDIPAVSLLLTHIIIKPREKLDLGSRGIYTVQSGDTLSQIAQRNGFSTKELLKRNSWFICHRDYANNIDYMGRRVA